MLTQFNRLAAQMVFVMLAGGADGAEEVPMNAVEIADAISELAAEPYDAASFPFAFLEAFGNKPAVLAKLKNGASNSSDVKAGVLQHSNIHIATCETGMVTEILCRLKDSSATKKAKAKFILATDGGSFEAEDLISGEILACTFKDVPKHFGFFLPLAGITTVRQIRDSTVDIHATGRLNKLYVQLLKDNEEWQEEAHFPATIADLYHPETMPGNLRRAHERNDETLERIFIGRRFRNDTERLEVLFKMYSKMKRGAA